MTELIKKEQLEKLVTTEFLITLLEVSKLYGWDGDYFEISNFVEELHKIKGIENGIVEPYKIEG